MRIDGKKSANKILGELKTKVEKLKEKNIIPHLAIILIGNDPASHAYVRQKKLKGDLINAKTTILHLPSNTSSHMLLKTIQQFNNNNNIHGIIVQQPLPPQINLKEITTAINPKKDVDGFHPKSKFQSPIALAVLKILEEVYQYSPRRSPFGHLRGGVAPAAHLGGEYEQWLKTKKIAILGKGKTGGKPIIDMFKQMGIKHSIIDSKTKNPSSITKKADIIISAIGKPQVVKQEMIKKDSILISIGLSKGKDGKLHGDYDEDKVKNIVSFYTPTPGGVGPVNVAMLLENLVTAAKN